MSTDWISMDGRRSRKHQAEIQGMHQPAECAHCGRVYDLGTVTITARYADCSVWKSPCCGRTVDDRGETGWKSSQDYYRLDQHGRRKER